tara:strand:+ start:2560 stop:3300 length:741 start_codon:yes stop_codon:yes gene_type:complete
VDFHIEESTGAVRCGSTLSAHIKAHAWQQYPKESVGAIVRGEYVPLHNVHPSPHTGFMVNQYPDDLEALVHSHPDTLTCPSAADMSQQAAMDVPWGIVSVDGKSSQVSEVEWFGEGCPIPPLLGRTFLSGVRDCWCLVKDWYTLNHPEIGHKLPQLPRDHDWYKDEIDLLGPQNIEDAGFEQIHISEMRLGDVILGRIGSRVVNHCGVYWGGNQALSHMEGRLSRLEVVHHWLQRAEYILRHRDMP